MTYVYAPRECMRCEKEYTPTGSAQKHCKQCAPIHKREYNLRYYHENGGRAWNRQYKRDNRESTINLEDFCSEDDFRVMVVNMIQTRRGTMMSTKTTMRRLLKRLGIDEVWGQKRNRGGLAKSFFEIVYEEFDRHGGVLFGTTKQAGDQYNFPLRKVEK